MNLLDPLRHLAGDAVRTALGSAPADLEDYRAPAGDPGLFGPQSLVWQVHADLPAMLIGGFSALMLQTLHPLAMAGVADHSRYQQDPLGRLRRTAAYVAGTSFGAMPLVDRYLEQVRRVHLRVRGVAPDGRAYSADDPQLVTWVHTTEVWSFVRSFQRYSLRPLLTTEVDRYLAEVAVLAELLGGTDIPRSRRQVRSYFAAMRDEVRAEPDAIEAFDFLRRPFGASLPEVVAHRVIADAAVDLLPAWARWHFGAVRSALPGAPRLATRAAAVTFAELMRWAVGPSLVRIAAEQRVRAS